MNTLMYEALFVSSHIGVFFLACEPPCDGLLKGVYMTYLYLLTGMVRSTHLVITPLPRPTTAAWVVLRRLMAHQAGNRVAPGGIISGPIILSVADFRALKQLPRGLSYPLVKRLATGRPVRLVAATAPLLHVKA